MRIAVICFPLFAVYANVVLPSEDLARHSDDAAKAERAFSAAMEGPWLAALKEGRLEGPLFGAAEMNAPPREIHVSRNRIPVVTSVGQDTVDFLYCTQDVDGRWSSLALGSQLAADVEQTALALLVFLNFGHTERRGAHKQTVRDAVAWLRSRQREDGLFLNEGWTHPDGATHALAVLALCETVGMAACPETQAAAQRGIDAALRQQDKETGGFARQEGGTPDLFTTFLYVQALRSAKIAQLKVSHEWFEGAIRFLDRLEDKETHSFSYVPGGQSSTQATLLGALCRSWLGWKRDDLRETVEPALKALGEPSRDRKDENVLFTYVGTWLAYNMGGETWSIWGKSLRNAQRAMQIEAGPLKGGFAPRGVCGGGGWVLPMAFNVLSRIPFRRYLCLYK